MMAGAKSGEIRERKKSLTSCELNSFCYIDARRDCVCVCVCVCVFTRISHISKYLDEYSEKFSRFSHTPKRPEIARSFRKHARPILRRPLEEEILMVSGAFITPKCIAFLQS